MLGKRRMLSNVLTNIRSSVIIYNQTILCAEDLFDVITISWKNINKNL